MIEKEQPEVMAPDAAIDTESVLPAGVGAPDEDLDAVLEALDPVGEADEDEEELPFGGEEEEEEELPEEADQAPEVEPEPEDQVDKEEKPVEEGIPGDDLEKAIAALKRDGLPASVIEKMTNSEIVALGEKRAKVQGDADNAYRELTELKNQKEMATDSETESAALAEPTDQPVSANAKEAIQPFADIFGEDAAEALSEYGKASMAPLLETIQAQSNMLEAVLMDSAKGKLQDRFPQLADGESYARVSDRMRSLAKPGEYADIDNLMSDAARIEFSDETKQVADEISSKRARQKAVGQMTPAGGAETPEHSLGVEEREDKLLEALESGMPRHEAQRLFGRA